MKKIVTFIIITFAVIGLNAQNMGGASPVLLNYNSLIKKVDKSDADIQNAKKAVNAATWFNRGELFQDVFQLGLEQLQEGMGPATLTLFYKEPQKKETETIDGSLHERYYYEHMIYTFVDGGLQEWERVDPIVDDPLEVAREAYMKALELDTKGKLNDKIKADLTLLKDQLKRQGVNYYYTGDFAESLSDFETVLDINKLDLFAGEFDTIMVQYSGIIAREIATKTDDKDLYRKAIGYYQQLADADFGGPNTYLQMKSDYMLVGDTVKALDALKEAYEKYPDTLSIITHIVDTYIQMHQIDNGLDFMDGVIARNPNVAEYYYWKGRLLINKEDEDTIDEAIAVYKKATELNSNLFYVYYDLGYIYYLQGADFYERAGTEADLDMQARLNELGSEKYNESIPVLEKSFQLNDENYDVKYETLDLLQRMYYKEQRMEDYERVKALKDSI